MTHEEVLNGQWSEVVRRKPPKKNSGPPLAISRATGLSINRTVSARKIKPRPAGIFIDGGSDADFPALAKKIKTGMDKKTVGDNITGIRKTRNGGLLIEVRGDQATVDIVKEEASRAAGGDAAIRVVQQRTMVEIRDIDAWSDRGDVKDSIHHETSIPEDSIKIVSLRTAFGGSQTALVLLPTANAKAIIADGRIKISVVNCRVRLVEKKRTRCYRCLGIRPRGQRMQGSRQDQML